MASASIVIPSSGTHNARLWIDHETLDSDQIEQHSQTLASAQTPLDLEIANAHFSPGGVTALAQGIKQNQTLSKFQLVVGTVFGSEAQSSTSEREQLITKRGNEEDLLALGDALAQHPTLTDLVTSGLRLNDLELKAFGAVFSSKNLQSVHLNQAFENPSIALEQLVHLIADASLQRLHLEQNKLQHEHIPLVAKLIATAPCTELYLDYNDLAKFQPNTLGPLLAAAAQNPHLEVLSLGNNGISSCTEEEKEIISTSLKTASLKKLILRNNFVGKDIGEALAEGLSEHPSLHTLDLSRALLKEGAPRLFQSLQTNRSLRHLDLSNSDLTCEAVKNPYGNQLCQDTPVVIQTLAEAMYEGLSNNSTLETLILDNNPLGPQGGLAIARAFMNLPRKDANGNDLPYGKSGLKRLSLRATSLLAGGIELIARLRYNNSLENLDLSKNNLANAPVKDRRQSFLGQLGYTLSQNQVLRVLSIGENHFGSLGDMAGGLAENSSLERLDLGYRFSSIAPGSRFLKALNLNKTLLDLTYYQHHVGEAVSTEIDGYLKRNQQQREKQRATTEA